MMTRSGKTDPKVNTGDDIQIILNEQQAQMTELKDELQRVITLRAKSEKENDMLRVEIGRLLELQKQNQNVRGNGYAGGTKTDVCIQTENLAIDDTQNKNVSNKLIDQEVRGDVNETFQLPQVKNNISNDNLLGFGKSVEFTKQSSVSDRGYQPDNQETIFKGIMNYLQSLQVSVPLPKFDCLKRNPIEFVKELEKYFLRKNIAEDLKLIIVEEALNGRAKMWYDARSFPFIDYQHFKEKFLEEFYSIEARMVAKSEWENRRYKASDRSLEEYYIEQLREVKFCLLTLKEYEINYLIMKQLPHRAREVLATIDYFDTSKILQALARLDVARRDSEAGTSFNGYNTNFSNKFNQNKSIIGSNRQNNNNNEGDTSDRGVNAQPTRHINNNDIDKSRNWRQRSLPPPRHFRDQTREGTQDSSSKVQNEGQTNDHSRPSVRAIQKSNMSEFAEELCWDVEVPEEEVGSFETKVASPRIRAKIEDHEVAVLVDSGSEVTVISESFYSSLGKEFKIVELPVSNVTVNVAVGNKSTVIKRQVQLALQIGTEVFESPFLVVPGLATNVLVGIDWLLRFKCIIDVGNQRIRLDGRDLPDELVTFRMSREVKAACRIIQTQGQLWYSSEVSKYRLGNCIKKQEVNPEMGDVPRSSPSKKIGIENNKQIRCLSDGENDFEWEVNEYLSKINTLDRDQKENVKNLLMKYRDVFSTRPGCTNEYSHPIILMNSKAVVRKSYPVALSQKAAVRAEIDRMMTLGIIERSNSNFCNPLRVVTKKNGEVRLCLDARFINAAIKSDNECPPRMEELLQKFEGAKFLSTTDLVMGYWQVPLEFRARQYTAFLHEGHLYQFTRIPFGLKTAGSGFIRALNLSLGQELSEVISCYVDDILIASASFEEHIEHLSRLFERLKNSGFTISFKKSSFFCDEVSFLGFKLSPDGIRADPEKLAIISEFPCPKDKRQLQEFLGVCGYYRRFSVKHAEFIGPFRELLSSKSKWTWNESYSKAFQDLKNNFLRAVTLSHYLPHKKFRLQTDASDMGVSGVLYQEDDDGDIRIVSLTSRVLTGCESRYTTSEKELLAIIHSLIKFRMYLVGWKFEIITDHQALTYLLSTPYHNARLMRWILYMQEYQFDIRHCKGSDNLVADFFSRNFGHESSIDNNNNFLLCEIVRKSLEQKVLKEAPGHDLYPSYSFSDEIISELKNLNHLQREDNEIMELMRKSRSKLKFKEESGVIYVGSQDEDRWRVAIPRCLVMLLLKSVHERLGHAGGYKMFEYLERLFRWKYMRRDIKNFVRQCDLCQRTKYINYKMEGSFQWVKANRPNEFVAVDFYGPLPASTAGVSYIFVVQDLFSKLVTLYPIKRANTKTCLEKLKGHYFAKIGKPSRILSDHGTQFTSPLWKTSLEAEGVKVVYSTIRHPQSNPVERTMRELGRFFRTYCAHKHTSWARYISKIQECLNLMYHQSTGAVPLTLHFGRSPRDQMLDLFPVLKEHDTDYEVYLQLAQDRLQRSFDQRSKSQKSVSKVILKEKDLVLLRVPHASDASLRVTHKFFHLYEGPYRIMKIINYNACLLVDPQDDNKVKGTYNRLHLRRYYRADG